MTRRTGGGVALDMGTRIQWSRGLCLGLAAWAAFCVSPALAEGRWEEGGGVRTYDFRGFTRVDVGGAFDATVGQGEEFSVTVHADPRDMDRVEVRCDGGTLRVGMRWWPPFRFTFLRSRPRLEVTMPRIEGLAASGASRITARCDAGGQGVDIDLSGASEVRGSLRGGSLRLGASGASRAELSGGAGKVTATASGASRLLLAGFEAEEADLSLSGASTAEVAARRLSVDASGASGVRYRGEPVLGRMEMSGGSWVRRD